MSLYNKYRPTTLNDVVGQSFTIQCLNNAINNNKLPHTILLTGLWGVGKTTIARCLANSLNIDKDDINEINAASSTGIDDIRKILDMCRMYPSKSKYKLYILDEVHQLSNSAFSALLKVLEEPAKHNIFVLCTTEDSKLPTTIKSRCTNFVLNAIDRDVMFNYLKDITIKESVKIDDASIHLVVRKSNGSMRDALVLLEKLIMFSNEITIDYSNKLLMTLDYHLLDSFFVSYYNNKIDVWFPLISEFINNGISCETFAKEMLNYCRIMLIYITNSSDTSCNILSESCKEIVLKLKLKICILLNTLNDYLITYKHIGHKQLALELLFIDFKIKLKEKNENSNTN